MSQNERTPDSESVYYDEEVLILDVLWRWLTYTALLCVPPLLIGRKDAPPVRRFYRWRYVYGAFAILTLTLYGPKILAGEFAYLLLIPIIHISIIVSLVFVVLTGSAPGVAYTIIPDGIMVLSHGLWLGGVAVIEWARRADSGILGMSGPEFHREEDEFIVPMAEIDDSSVQAPAVPRMDQSVSTAFIGETGSGKTSAMQLLAEQFPDDEDIAVFVHDYGDDFQQFYAQKLATEAAEEDSEEEVPDTDLATRRVLRISAQNSDVIWNLFRDVEGEQDLRELAGAVFGEPEGRDPFHNPALQVFEAVLIYLYREAQARDRLDAIGHDDVVKFVNQKKETIHERLKEYDDQVGAASHIDPSSSRAASTIYSTLHENVRDVFVGDFAKHGEFSLRDYLHDPCGVLVVDSSSGDLETCGPMFRLLVDWSIKRAMTSSTEANFILDEIDRLPPLQQLPELAARGRSEGARALIGVQTVGHLKYQYEGASSGVLGNCPQGI